MLDVKLMTRKNIQLNQRNPNVCHSSPFCFNGQQVTNATSDHYTFPLNNKTVVASYIVTMLYAQSLTTQFIPCHHQRRCRYTKQDRARDMKGALVVAT